MEHNPVAKAALPKSEAKQRAIWTADDLFKALSVCEDDRLALAINLAFSCSLRLGEITGLTWDCVDVDASSIADNNASVYIEKELMRVSKNALEKLSNKDVVKVFPAVFTSNNTCCCLKSPKQKAVSGAYGCLKLWQRCLSNGNRGRMS
jgi:integrase